MDVVLVVETVLVFELDVDRVEEDLVLTFVDWVVVLGGGGGGGGGGGPSQSKSTL